MVTIRDIKIIAVSKILIINLGLVNCDCVLKLNKDFCKPHPVTVYNGSLILPNREDGSFVIKTCAPVTVSCPDKGFLVYGEEKTLWSTANLKCMPDGQFYGNGWEGPFKKVRCCEDPNVAVQLTDVTCFGISKMIRVGYRVSDEFHTLYEACFDPYMLITRYVKHHLTPASFYRQYGEKPKFEGIKYFRNINMTTVYRRRTQWFTMKSRFGKSLANKYITKKHFLTKGHLAPRRDFTMYNDQRATYQYINSAPQWYSGNGGDWSSLENALRLRIKRTRRNVTVYTGVHSITTLRNEKRLHKHLYLHRDESYNDLIPVPLYFYKLVFDSNEGTATAFVSINNPHYNRLEIDKLTICRDICEDNEEFRWLKWRRNDNITSFCCCYDEFINTVRYLPRLHVYGVFH